MKRALIVGATGLIGKALLDLLLQGHEYTKVYAVGRRSLDFSHPKLVTQVVDFDDMEGFSLPEKVHDLFITLGTTRQKAGSREAFVRVDHDYVASFAQWGAANGVEKVLVISSIGADPLSSNFYLKTKGGMEEAVKKCGIAGTYIFRPALLLGDRKEFRLGEKMGEWLLWVSKPLLMGRFRRYRPIEASQVAYAMYNTAQTVNNPLYVMESDEIALI